jgi:hypothetical protein
LQGKSHAEWLCSKRIFTAQKRIREKVIHEWYEKCDSNAWTPAGPDDAAD